MRNPNSYRWILKLWICALLVSGGARAEHTTAAVRALDEDTYAIFFKYNDGHNDFGEGFPGYVKYLVCCGSSSVYCLPENHFDLIDVTSKTGGLDALEKNVADSLKHLEGKSRPRLLIFVEGHGGLGTLGHEKLGSIGYDDLFKRVFPQIRKSPLASKIRVDLNIHSCYSETAIMPLKEALETKDTGFRNEVSRETFALQVNLVASAKFNKECYGNQFWEAFTREGQPAPERKEAFPTLKEMQGLCRLAPKADAVGKNEHVIWSSYQKVPEERLEGSGTGKSQVFAKRAELLKEIRAMKKSGEQYLAFHRLVVAIPSEADRLALISEVLKSDLKTDTNLKEAAVGIFSAEPYYKHLDKALENFGSQPPEVQSKVLEVMLWYAKYRQFDLPSELKTQIRQELTFPLHESVRKMEDELKPFLEK